MLQILTLYYIYWQCTIFLLFQFVNLTFYRIYELQWLYHSSVFCILIKSFISFRCFIFDCMCLCVWHILNKETTTTTTTTTTILEALGGYCCTYVFFLFYFILFYCTWNQGFSKINAAKIKRHFFAGVRDESTEVLPCLECGFWCDSESRHVELS